MAFLDRVDDRRCAGQAPTRKADEFHRACRPAEVSRGPPGVWAVHSWQRSLFTLVTLVGVWAVFHGVNEIFAAVTLRQTGREAERLLS